MENEFEKGFMAGFLLNYHKKEDGSGLPSGSWTYPSNWLKLPEPADNQIVLLVDNKGETPFAEISYIYRANVKYSLDHNSTINWGDGSGSVPIWKKDPKNGYTCYHKYEPGTGHMTENSEQWIVTITFDKNAEIGTEYIINLSDTTYFPKSMYVIAAKIGNSKYVGDRGTGKTSPFSLSTGPNLQYIKICRGEFDFAMQNSRRLCQVELNNQIAAIPAKAFYNCYGLCNINLENITEVGDSAFFACRQLDTSGKMPKLVSIDKYSFAYSKLSNLDFPCLETIGSYAFQYCSLLIHVSFPYETLKTIGAFAFDGCSSLITIDFPYVTEASDHICYTCKALEKVNLPLVTKVGDYAFSDCLCLKVVNLESCTELGKNAFRSCYNLANCTLHTGADITDKMTSSYNVKIKYVDDKTEEGT